MLPNYVWFLLDYNNTSIKTAFHFARNRTFHRNKSLYALNEHEQSQQHDWFFQWNRYYVIFTQWQKNVTVLQSLIFKCIIYLIIYAYILLYTFSFLAVKKTLSQVGGWEAKQDKTWKQKIKVVQKVLLWISSVLLKKVSTLTFIYRKDARFCFFLLLLYYSLLPFTQRNIMNCKKVKENLW